MELHLAVTIDANVFISAADEQNLLHSAAEAALTRELSSGERIVLFVPPLISYLRVVTHPSLFRRPLSLERAFGNLLAITELPNVSVEAHTLPFVAQLAQVARQVEARGKLIHNAEIVTLMNQHTVQRILTADRDFLKFDGIEVSLLVG